MIKLLHRTVWCFDTEWIPDPATGRAVYGLGNDLSDEEVVSAMWSRGGATEMQPRPYLKTVLCRIVSVAAVIRTKGEAGEIIHQLFSLPTPTDDAMGEAEIVGRFLSGIGKERPQLVGFNSRSADIPALIQRALVHRLHQPEFCARPDKPWNGTDYFGKYSDYNIDLKDEVGEWGKATPSLHEIAVACGIPGKMDASGASVIDLWRAGKIREIVQYNECDAITTFLLWIRLVHLAGLVTTPEYVAEVAQVQAMLEEKAQSAGNGHLTEYLVEWKRLCSGVLEN